MNTKNWSATSAWFVCCFVAGQQVTAFAQVNSWTNSASGHWEDPSWSLGTPPAATQSIVITNNGFKAVGIFPGTPANFPGTMTIAGLTISAIPGSFNTLLLNFPGTHIPLRVTNGCLLGQYGTILNLDGALEVDGGLAVNGGQLGVNGGDLTALSAPVMLESGGINLTNAQTDLDTLEIGEDFSSFYQTGPAVFTQIGGATTNGSLLVGPYGAFDLFDGANYQVSDVASNAGTLSLFGGTFAVPSIVEHGTMNVSNAVISGNPLLDLAGTLSLNNASLQFGALTLSGDSILDFQSAPATIHFAGAGAAWSSGSKLTIENWAGSLGGGGADELFFGNNANGLSGDQLAHAQFLFPSNLLHGAYLVRALPTGEIVPTGKLSVFGWGDDYFGEATAPAGLTGIMAVAAGLNFSIALKKDGTLAGWGNLDAPSSLSNVVAISAGGPCAMALNSDGSAEAWGSTPAMPPLTNLVGVSAGWFPTAIRADGTLVFPHYTDGTTGPSGVSNLIATASGEYHLLLLGADGTVTAWGLDDSAGQTNVPPGLSNVIAIAAGGNQSLALKDDGTIVSWGSGASPPLSNIVAIAANRSSASALNSDGTVVSWGIETPTGLTNVAAIAGGEFHSLALLESTPAIHPQLSCPHRLPNGSFQFAFMAPLGHRYVVERSVNLADWAFLRNIAGTGVSVTISDDHAAALPQSFYRARMVL